MCRLPQPAWSRSGAPQRRFRARRTNPPWGITSVLLALDRCHQELRLEPAGVVLAVVPCRVDMHPRPLRGTGDDSYSREHRGDAAYDFTGVRLVEVKDHEVRQR